MARDHAAYFATRLEFDPRRRVLWRTLYDAYFRQLIRPADCVLDLGCGHGEFINAVEARRRIAVDLWSEFPRYVDKGVECHVGSITDLSFLAEGEIDVAFASNVLEHLTPADAASALEELHRVVKPAGTLIFVQPNYRYAFREYFDDYTHLTAYSHISLCDLISAHGFEVTRVVPRFMPLTIKSRFRVSPLLIRAYLRSPIKPWAKQMLIVARRRG